MHETAIVDKARAVIARAKQLAMRWSRLKSCTADALSLSAAKSFKNEVFVVNLTTLERETAVAGCCTRDGAGALNLNHTADCGEMMRAALDILETLNKCSVER